MKGKVKTFRNMKMVELTRIPKLAKCILPTAFACLQNVKMEDAGKLESVEELSRMTVKQKPLSSMAYPRPSMIARSRPDMVRRRVADGSDDEEEKVLVIPPLPFLSPIATPSPVPSERSQVKPAVQRRVEASSESSETSNSSSSSSSHFSSSSTDDSDTDSTDSEETDSEESYTETESDDLADAFVVRYKGDWDSLQSSVEHIVVSSHCCNEADLDLLVLSKLNRLRSFVVGDDCFENVDELKIIGLEELEMVEIGANCFTQWKNKFSCVPYRHFYLKSCPSLVSLVVGSYSFSDYSVCEIEDAPALRVVEMNEMKEDSYSFYFASLELKSPGILKGIMTRHAFSQNT